MIVTIQTAIKEHWTTPEGVDKEYLKVSTAEQGEVTCWNPQVFTPILQAMTSHSPIDLNIRPNQKGKNQIYGLAGQGGFGNKGKDKDWDKINAEKRTYFEGQRKEEREYKEREVDISQALVTAADMAMKGLAKTTLAEDMIIQINLIAPQLIEIKRNLRKNYK